MTNPNPQYITDQMWNLWLGCEKVIPGVRLGGIYAHKPGYHSTVNDNKISWPNDYSIRLPLDLTQPDNKARAIDLTMDDGQMRKCTELLRASAFDAVDDRLSCVREFYGTLDGFIVYGLIKDDENGPWRGATSDSSHLWHIHISIFTAFCSIWSMLAPVASVLSGQSYAQWKGMKAEMGFLARDTQNRLVIITDDWNGWYRPPLQNNAAEIQQAITDRSYWRTRMGLPTERWISENGTTQAKFNFGDQRTDSLFGPNLAPTSSSGGGGVVSGPVDLTESAIAAVANRVCSEESKRLAG